MAEDNEPGRAGTHGSQSEMSEAEIDKNLQDTFPASDPPSWTLGTNHRAESPPEDVREDDDDEASRG